MRPYRLHWIALLLVTAWAVFSVAYLGAEDGSSGMSPLGYVHFLFFLPGMLLMEELRGSQSNADVPLMAAISWLVFTLIAWALAHMVAVLANVVSSGHRNRDVGSA